MPSKDDKEQKEHRAYNVKPILEKLPLEISSLASRENTLFVGCKNGLLVIYEIKPYEGQPSGQQFEIKLAKSFKNFAKKPITQLTCVAQYEILISLSDSSVYVHSLLDNRLDQLCALSDPKGSNLPSLFTVDNGKEGLRLCVAYRRTVQVYDWESASRKFVPTQGIGLLALPDAIRSMALTRHSLWCGFVKFNSDYITINLRDGSGTQRTLFSSGANSYPTVTKLLNRDMTHYDMALGSDNTLVVLDKKAKPVYTHPLTFTEAPQVLEYDEPYIIGVSTNVEIISHLKDSRNPRGKLQSDDKHEVQDKDCGFRQKLESIRSPSFITKHGSVIYIASKKEVWRLDQVPEMDQIKMLMMKRSFELALKLAENYRDIKDTEIESSNRRAKLVHAIKIMQAFDLFRKKEFEAALKLFFELKVDPTQVVGMVPDMIPPEAKATFRYPADSVPELKGNDLTKCMNALKEYLADVRQLIVVAESKGEKTMESTALTTEPPPCNQVDMLHQVVDTSLLICYVKTNDSRSGSLLRLKDNRAYAERVEKVLKAENKVNELVEFYKSKGKHKQALDLLEKQSGQANSSLKGHERTVQYLQELGAENLELIFKYGRWILEAEPEDGLTIFTEDNHSCDQLPPDKVLEYLEQINVNLAIQYLEHLIHTRKLEQEYLHNQLVMQYKNVVEAHLKEYLASLPEGHPPATAGEEPGSLGKTRKKMLDFMRTSILYDPRELLVSFPADNLFLERAILLGRVGRHDQALAIYVYNLRNDKLAEHYCEDIAKKKLPSSRWESVYLSLFSTYLNPKKATTTILSAQANMEPRIPQALKVLEKHWSMIDLGEALKLLPPDIPLKKVSNYLENVLRHKTNQKRDDQVLRSLFYYQKLRCDESRMMTVSQKVEITSEDCCTVCGKRIGNAAFLHCPTGEIVHLNCYQRRERGRNVGGIY